jgi:hypothetical protein
MIKEDTSDDMQTPSRLGMVLKEIHVTKAHQISFLSKVAMGESMTELELINDPRKLIFKKQFVTRKNMRLF